MKEKLIGLCLLLAGATGFAQTHPSFAILVDTESYKHCKSEIENYRESIRQDGLDAFIAVKDWERPEEVRDSLLTYYRQRNLEGTVFIGDIPVAMVRKAHHLTSAFKMDEQWGLREASVPSDRFYDDFDLKFRYVCRDTTQTNLFYYDLAPDSPQEITCDIYSGRIRPAGTYQDPYRELAAYLQKAVRIRSAENKLDQVTSYTGEGSFSNSLVAWKDESVTLAEQMPDAFTGRNEARFFVFAMHPYMKETMLEEISRKDLDLVLFHEHGMPERQYLTGTPAADGRDAYYEMGKYHARGIIRTKMRYGKTFEEAMAAFAEEHPEVDPSWYDDAMDPAVMAADSLEDLKTGIILDDIQKTAPNVKMAIFDACYNGDFREKDNIANRYIMAGGDCVVGIGNSVNVLQDKSSSDLMGMLAAGYRVGEWMQQINILESHIMGDPTFRFSSSYPGEKPDLKNTSCDYWLSLLTEEQPCDIRGLALHKLYALHYEHLSDLLLLTYRSSPYYMERLQCLHLLAHYDDGNYEKLLLAGLDDPYEFIRRKCTTFAGKVGTGLLAEALAKAYLNDVNSKRVAFDIGFSSGHFPDRKLEKALLKEIEEADFILNKEKFKEEAEKLYASGIRMAESTEEIIRHPGEKPGRLRMYLSGMRNNPYPYLADELVRIVQDQQNPEELRVQTAEVLGWFNLAWNRKEIQEQLQGYLHSGAAIPQRLEEEITKTLGRLACYSRN